MERNSFKDQRIGSKAIRDSWSSNSESYGEDYLAGFSWPPRSYTCSFCKREFRSAQALGGHMNVHRRDRARLRQSPPTDGQYPFLNLNVNPNPNPNFSTPPPPVSPSCTRTLPSLASPPLSSLSSPSSASPTYLKKCGRDGTLTDPLSTEGSDLTRNKSFKRFLGVNEFNGFTEEEKCELPKKPAEIVRLDLEIGLISDSKEDLDLELRLGYS